MRMTFYEQCVHGTLLKVTPWIGPEKGAMIHLIIGNMGMQPAGIIATCRW